MTKKRKFYPTKKLGELRRDVKIEDKKEFIKRIIKYKEKYKTVSADYKKKFGKHLPRSTFNDWKNKGVKYLDEKKCWGQLTYFLQAVRYKERIRANGYRMNKVFKN